MSTTSTPLALPEGYRLERYVIEKVLGQGGFGITYLAVEEMLGKRVAIKELLPTTLAARGADSTVVPHSEGGDSDWEWAKRRFLEEARVLAKFRHPAIVDVHRYLEANGTAYIVMEYVEGETYEAVLRAKGREESEETLMAVMGPLMDGVAELHRESLLHRDIKPENIVIRRDGRPVLIDFGAARYAMAGRSHSMTAIVSHGYSALEQYSEQNWEGKSGPWTDVYSLWAVMSRAITGNKPASAPVRFDEDEGGGLAESGVAGYRKEFLAAVDWAMKLRGKERPQTLEAWRAALEGRSAVKKVDTPPRRSGALALALVVLLLGLAGAGGWYWGVHSPEESERIAREAVAEAAAQAKAEAEAERVKKEDKVKAALPRATKEEPFENSVGMKFVPVPGTDVLMQTTEVTVDQWKKFVRELEAPDFEQGGNHPVVNVSWLAAKYYCEWLSEKEGKTYRLPTDHEWSCAVGIGEREDAEASPESKHGKVEDEYPWGSGWQPRDKIGNYDEDEYSYTSPVARYAPNDLGIYDLGGNVLEWCEDKYSPSDFYLRVLRGGSYNCGGSHREDFLSSCRYMYEPWVDQIDTGFRVVIAVSDLRISLREKLVSALSGVTYTDPISDIYDISEMPSDLLQSEGLLLEKEDNNKDGEADVISVVLKDPLELHGAFTDRVTYRNNLFAGNPPDDFPNNFRPHVYAKFHGDIQSFAKGMGLKKRFPGDLDPNGNFIYPVGEYNRVFDEPGGGCPVTGGASPIDRDHFYYGVGWCNGG